MPEEHKFIYSKVGLKGAWFLLTLVSSVTCNKLGGLDSTICVRFDSVICFK